MTNEFRKREIMINGLSQSQGFFAAGISTNNIKSLDDSVLRILKDVCEEEPGYYHLTGNLIALQETKTVMISKYGLHNDVEKRIESFVNQL